MFRFSFFKYYTQLACPIYGEFVTIQKRLFKVVHNNLCKQSSQWHFKRQGDGAAHVKVSAPRIDVPFIAIKKIAPTKRMHPLAVYALEIRHTKTILFSKP